MLKSLSKLPEWRILGFMAVVALGWHLLTIFGNFLGSFADVLLVLVLSWILAFILEPLVTRLSKQKISPVVAALTVYSFLAVGGVVLVWIILPTTIVQLSQLSETLPSLIPQNSVWSNQLETFLTSSLANSVLVVSQVASTLTSLILIFILSFYFLITKNEIASLILKIIPDQYEEDYLFLQNVVSATFASFIRIQVFLGLTLGVVTYIVLLLLGVEFALSTSLFAGLLAMVPVVGPILFLVPAIIAALTKSPQTVIIVAIVLTLAAQLVYNVWAPRLMGKALNIHPIVVLISFIVGYKIGGVWGAIFAVPVIASLSIIAKDLLRYWYEEADKK